MELTFGLIVGNRGFFPDKLAEEGRDRMIKVLEEEGFKVICPSKEETKLGTVETWEDAKKCAEIFKSNRDKIDGIIVSLPNFGDEKGVANTIRLSELNVPILIQAFRDRSNALDLPNRGDAFCGKISVCNNLYQYRIPFSLTSLHTVDPEEDSFKNDLRWFAGVCRIIRGLRNLKVGAIGARPNAFNTVRYSEKILESYGISVETIDLSEVIAKVNMLKSSDPIIKEEIEDIKGYANVEKVPTDRLELLAKLSLVIKDWVKENDIKAIALQCWTSIEYNLSIMPCVVMSILSDRLVPSACEVDITGAVSMYILQLASHTPSALVDWNNNYDYEEDKAIIFHCGNLPRSVLDIREVSYGDIIGGTVGKENAYGICVGKVKPGPLTFARITTDDICGDIKAYVGEGEVVQDIADTFGASGIVKINRLQELMHYVCKNGFEHHVAINRSSVARIIYEALENYMGINTYWHR